MNTYTEALALGIALGALAAALLMVPTRSKALAWEWMACLVDRFGHWATWRTVTAMKAHASGLQAYADARETWTQARREDRQLEEQHEPR